MREQWIKHDSLGSTNNFISDLLKQQDLKEGTVIVADYQDAGRGQGNHSWHSRRGENLLMSMLLFPEFLSASQQFHLSKAVSLAICDVLGSVGIDAYIKWPNDILSSRGKIAGILIEHSILAGNISHSIAGVGLNLNQKEFPDFPLPASSLYLETGKSADVSAIGELVEARLLARYLELKRGSLAELDQEYLDKLYRAGIPTRFETLAGSFEGIIEGVNDFGELQVMHAGETRVYGHGSIRMDPESDWP